MHKTMIILLLLGTLFIGNDSVYSASADVQIVEPAKVNSEIQRQLESLERVEKHIEQNFERYDKRFEQYDRSTDRLYNFVQFGLAGMALIISFFTWIGFKTVGSWIKKTIETKTDAAHKEFEKYMKEKVDEIISEYKTDARKKLSGIEATWQDYQKTLDTLKSHENAGEDFRLPTKDASEKENLAKFVDDLAAVKTEEQYTYEDWYFKGMAAYDKQKYSLAVDCLQKAIQLEPTNVAYANLGLTFKNLNKFEDALTAFNKALEFDSDDDWSLSQISDIYIYQKNYEQAKQFLQKACLINKRRKNDRLVLMELFIITGDAEKAKEISDFKVKSNEIIKKLFESIIYRLEGTDTTDVDEQINEYISQGKIKHKWSFAELEQWVSSPDIDPNIREYIQKMVRLLS